MGRSASGFLALFMSIAVMSGLCPGASYASGDEAAAPQACASAPLPPQRQASIQASTSVSGDWGSCHWALGDDGVLRVSGGKAPEPQRTGGDTQEASPWHEYASDITEVVFSAAGGERVVFPKDSGDMFNGFENLEEVDFSGVDTSLAESMDSMFRFCASLKKLDLSGFDTTRVKSMNGMFYACESLESVSVASFRTSAVTDMEDMFCGCGRLASLDVSGFDMSNVTTTRSMFEGCTALESLNAAGLATGMLEDAGYMFYDCPLRTIDLSGLRTSRSTVMEAMFYGSSVEVLVLGRGVTLAEGCGLREGVWGGPGGELTTGELIASYDGATMAGSYRYFPDGWSHLGLNGPSDDSGVKAYGDLSYGLNGDGDAVIVGCRSTARSLTIPGAIDGHTVVSIGGELSSGAYCNWSFSGCSLLETVSLPSTLRRIEECSFGDCTALESINCPASLEFVGYMAFQGCSSLKSITIPAGAEVERYAFHGCDSLGFVYVGTASQYEDFLYESKAPASATIVYSAPGGPSYQSAPISVGDGVYRIDHMRNVSLLAGWRADSTSASVAESVQGLACVSVAGCAFSGCEKLARVDIPASVESLGWRAFYGCGSLRGLALPSALRDIGDSAFELSGIESLSIPDGVTRLKKELFWWCYSLKDVYIPASVTDISDTAFFSVGEGVTLHASTQEQYDTLVRNRDLPLSLAAYNVVLDGQGEGRPDADNASAAGGEQAAGAGPSTQPASGAAVEGRAANPLTVKVAKKSITVKAKWLKKKARKVSVLKVTSAKGRVSYKNVSKPKILKKFSVAAKSGEITVPRSAKKGTYKVRIQVTAAGDAAHDPAVKTVTCKIKVK